MSKLTVATIRRAVTKLQQFDVPSYLDCYSLPMQPMAIIDILLTYKRPKATKLYRQLKESWTGNNNEGNFK